MKKGYKWLIGLGVLAALVVTLIFVLQDNADTEVIAAEQVESADEAADDMLGDLESSFDED